MIKVKKKYLGVVLIKWGKKTTLYNSIPQAQLEGLKNVFGSEYFYTAKTKKDDKDNEGND